MGHRLYDRNLGGAALMDLGIHPVSLAHAVLGGEPIAISESAVEFSSGVDIEFSATLHFGAGSKVCIAASIGRQLPGLAVISGEQGRVVIQNYWQPEIALIEIDGCEPTTLNRRFRVNGTEYEAIHFRECVRQRVRESPYPRPRETLEVHQTLAKIRNSW